MINEAVTFIVWLGLMVSAASIYVKFHGGFMQIRFWHRNRQVQPQRAFQSALTQIDEFNAYAQTLPCPNCKEKGGFKIVKYEQGTSGWELNVVCTKCSLIGILNKTGFSFEKTEGKFE